MITQFDIKQINILKDILLRLHYEEALEKIQADFHTSFKDKKAADILLAIYELKNEENGITVEDVLNLLQIYKQSFGHAIEDVPFPQGSNAAHPLSIFKEENNSFRSALQSLSSLIKRYNTDNKEQLITQMAQLGQFYSHYNRKEKILFPILERYGHYSLTRSMWADDDRIRTLFKGIKSMLQKVDTIDFIHIKKAFEGFENKFREMIFQEETFLLPILKSTFNKEDWLAVAKESDAFGYAVSKPDVTFFKEEGAEEKSPAFVAEHFPIGGGYLTIEEANHIFNNLPLEITFVDRNGLFKYFNEIIEASEMMFIRTQSSIGRNVANCHPPKSMSKVMRIIRDLKTKKRPSENMWFKKNGKYIHITYKGLFNENDEFLGILEYVQDIQPFFDLPREVKKELRQE